MKFVMRIGLLLALGLGSLTACSDDDGYDLGTVYLDYGMVDDHYTYGTTILLDGGTRLLIASNKIPYVALNDQERVLVNFTILGDADITNELSSDNYYIMLNGLGTVLSKEYVTLEGVEGSEETADQLGDDPIAVRSAWFGGKYLNVEFAVPRNNADLSKIHVINLVYDPDRSVSEGKAVFTLNHNAQGDEPNQTEGSYSYRSSLVSFDRTGLFDEQDIEVSSPGSVEIVVYWEEYANTSWESTVDKSFSGSFTPYRESQEIEINTATTQDNYIQ